MSKNKSLVLKETFKQVERVVGGTPALRCLWSPLVVQHQNCSRFSSSNKEGRRWLWWRWSRTHALGYGAWTAVSGARAAPPRCDWLTFMGPPRQYSLIAKSGPHRESECWPPQPAKEGHWTRSCKDTRAKRRI